MLGDGSVSVMPRIAAAGRISMFVYAAQVGFNVRNATIGSVAFGDEVRFALSGGVKVFHDKVIVGPELFAIAAVGSGSAARSFGLEGDLGAHYAVTDSWKVGAGVGTGLARAAGVPDVRLLASLDWSPQFVPPAPPDEDGDGVPDASDACPHDKGITSLDIQTNGCPAAADADKDGVPDSEDLCPQQPRGDHPDVARNGCPAPVDTDGDGVPDAADACPGEASGPTPSVARIGCPDVDSDGDGIFDALDTCPAQAAGAHADPKRPGCAMADRDGDGVPHEMDVCPDAAGAPSDDAQKTGCPGLVRLEGDHLRIDAPVKFAAASDRILDSSKDVLEAVASTLRAVPQIQRLSVEGHSDSSGVAAANQTLSERRAQSVMVWLVQHGVSADRLESHGFGQTRPIVVSDRTEADRATNRRVEFSIVQQSAR